MEWRSLIFFLLLTSSVSSLRVFCRFSTLNTIPSIYGCILERMEGTGRVVHEVIGEHEPGHTNSDVVIFVIADDPTIEFIPQGLGNFLPEIIIFATFETGISSLQGNEFFNLPRLQAVEMFQSRVERIPGALFATNPLLVEASFWRSPIRNVHENAFNHLQHLELLNFQLTACINRNANGREEVLSLIQDLRDSCPYFGARENGTDYLKPDGRNQGYGRMLREIFGRV